MPGIEHGLPSDFERRFGPSSAPLVQAWAPYRLSPLGAHTDHQDGLTCGFALDQGLSLIFRASPLGSVTLESRAFAGRVSFDLAAIPQGLGDWGDHVRAVAQELASQQVVPRGLQGLVTSDLSPGGIGSSAALQVAFLLALLLVNGLSLSPAAAMQLVVDAERKHNKVPIGLLDPAVILFGREDGLVFLDCKRPTPRVHRFSRKSDPFELLLIDSGQRRELRQTPYAQRVKECRQAAHEAGAPGDQAVLRDVDPEQWRRCRSTVDPLVARRADHVFAENKRVRLALQAVSAGDVVSFGHLMNASGRSLEVLFDCGTPETIYLLDLLRRAPGVLGASFSGAGFGGHLQALARPGTLPYLQDLVLKPYRQRYPSPGAQACATRVQVGARARVL